VELKWDESYNTGIEQIDEQHKELFVIVADLSAALMLSRAKYVISPILGRLVENIRANFEYEEELMRKYDYPDYELHKVVHGAFKAQLAELILRNENEEVLVSVHTYCAIRDWILGHIADVEGPYDHAMSRYILEHPDSCQEYLPEDLRSTDE